MVHSTVHLVSFDALDPAVLLPGRTGETHSVVIMFSILQRYSFAGPVRLPQYCLSVKYPYRNA